MRTICVRPGCGIVQRAKLDQHHRITREQLSVREHMSVDPAPPAGRKTYRVHAVIQSD